MKSVDFTAAFQSILTAAVIVLAFSTFSAAQHTREFSHDVCQWISFDQQRQTTDNIKMQWIDYKVIQDPTTPAHLKAWLIARAIQFHENNKLREAEPRPVECSLAFK
jgi:hypothetical protein